LENKKILDAVPEITPISRPISVFQILNVEQGASRSDEAIGRKSLTMPDSQSMMVKAPARPTNALLKIVSSTEKAWLSHRKFITIVKTTAIRHVLFIYHRLANILILKIKISIWTQVFNLYHSVN
jgi:hypothetical protein